MTILLRDSASVMSSAEQLAFHSVRLQELSDKCQGLLDIQDYGNAERETDLQSLLAALPLTATITRERIHPYLSRIELYMELFNRNLEPGTPYTHFIWGIVGVATEALSNVTARIPEALNMLDSLSQNLETLQSNALLVANLSAVNEVLLEAYCAFVEFWATVIRHLRRNELRANTKGNTSNLPGSSQPSQIGWQLIRNLYSTTTVRNQDWRTRLKEERDLVQSYQQQSLPMTSILPNIQQLEISNSSQITGCQPVVTPLAPPLSNPVDPADRSAYLPCYVISLSKNPHFQGRDDIMARVHLLLDQDASVPQFRSLALYGLGGIGKTQIALAYAHEQRERNLPSVFWINSEGIVDILQGFTAIALKLGLSSQANSQNYEQNSLLVLDWLQTTRTPWLLIFDNVEDVDLIRKYWPRAMQGSVIITSRDDCVAIDPCHKGIDVPVFSQIEGSRFLMEILDRENYSQDERIAAEGLSNSLGGLPLALNLMGQQIRLQRKQIKQLLLDYQRDPRRHHQTPRRGVQNSFYPHSIETVFRGSFALLQPHACSLLSAISFVSPDGVPEALFQSSKLPEEFVFCYNVEYFDNAMTELFSTSLISKDPDNQTIHVHRLVQAQFRDSMSSEEQYKNFLLTTKLLLECFPKHGKGQSLRNEFPTCRKFVIHIMALLDRLNEFNFTCRRPGDFEDFCELAAHCGWYLMEIGSWDQFSFVIDFALRFCEDKESLLYADLCNTIGSVESERGRASASRPYFETSLAIRQSKLPQDSELIADSINNYANVLNVEWKDAASLYEAEALFKRALAIDQTKTLVERRKVGHVRHFNLGTLYTCQERWDEAFEQLNLGKQCCLETFGANTHWHATAEYKIGNVHYFQGLWDVAKPYFEFALKTFLIENPTHHTVSASQLKLGTIAMKTGKIEEAISLLNKALAVCQLNEIKKGDKGDTARVLRRLSEVMELKGETGKATELKTLAESIRREVQGERYSQLPDCENSYNLMVYKAFW